MLVMASAGLKRELECSICLNIYTNPVNLTCGHNFCQVCIDHVLDTQEGSGAYSCPECRQEFQDRPALHRNITLRNIVENFLSSQPDQAGTDVFCTYCVDSPVPAVKSCLLCEASLCDKHLSVHKRSPAHVLSDPSTSMEKRKCSIHKEKILEYYCTEDSACICVSCCLIGEHRGHQMKSLNEASKKRKNKLKNVLQKLVTKREETEEILQSLQEHVGTVEEKATAERKRVTLLLGDLRKQLEDLEKRVLSEISKQAEEVSRSVNDLVQRMEIKKDELSRKMVHIEELCNMMDPLTILQESDKGDLRDTEDEDNEDRERHGQFLHDGGGLDVAEISRTLQAGLSCIMKEANEKIYIPEPADILLDVNTACNSLNISDDRKTVSYLPNQKSPETPERFKVYPQVISNQSFSSGQHYWEVNVGESQSWNVGMCYPSIVREEEKSKIGFNNKSWGLWKWNNQYIVAYCGHQIQLPYNISSGKVRIDLDYEAGRISFYDLCDPIQHLHTFTATFTEPLHAALGVWGGCLKISG
ncbi:E3 ubiquitin-protein ligase TRIM39-like [Aquarana catesbeiana]|uniref:E3 ubiquitin-protein ligase TRIM39-like n=1 Tax=Aquarana catesbeiana TaxID=8400 RepID=UPI003CC94892